MKRDEIIFQGLVVLFFGFMLFVNFQQHGVKRFGDMGSEFWPGLILAIGLLLSVILFFQSLGRYLKERPVSSPESLSEEERLLAASGRRKYRLAGVCLLGYILLMPWVGFILSTFLFVLAFILSLEERRPLVLAVSPLLVTALMVLVFGKFIGMPLPRGVEFFASFSRYFY